MRILYHHRIASKDGQFVHIEELTQALKSLGHELVVIGPAMVEKDEFGSDGGLVPFLKRHIPGVAYELLELGYSLIAYAKLRRAVRKYNPDCIYERYNLYLPAGVWIKRRYKLPMLLEVNAPLFDERSRYGHISLPRLARWTEQYVWRNADAVLPVSNVLANRMRNDGVSGERINVIPNGINLARFGEVPDSEEAKKRLGLQGRLVLGFTGFVRDWHRLDRIVDLLQNTSQDRHLLIVGDGPARRELEARARMLGVADRLTITGIVERKRVADYVAAFDIALQPDVVPYASPLKLFEYMAMGRVIVAPDAPNVREILQHEENGLLFDPRNPAAIAAAITRLSADIGLRKRLAKNARQTILNRGMTWEENAKRVESIFAHLGVKGLNDHGIRYQHVQPSGQGLAR